MFMKARVSTREPTGAFENSKQHRRGDTPAQPVEREGQGSHRHGFWTQLEGWSFIVLPTQHPYTT